MHLRGVKHKTLIFLLMHRHTNMKRDTPARQISFPAEASPATAKDSPTDVLVRCLGCSLGTPIALRIAVMFIQPRPVMLCRIPKASALKLHLFKSVTSPLHRVGTNRAHALTPRTLCRPCGQSATREQLPAQPRRRVDKCHQAGKVLKPRRRLRRSPTAFFSLAENATGDRW